ncbi:nuclear transport factor 2 family protein [Calothrix sp. UHCC 0171]|uniref:nuclear transport factor 2 family protein n=1 Tax=Calothrix sp. UHCC 0171 TaxID=3110245 RepID=UPI002B1EBDBA|nr:nuclear transport factor 2 family protein [Calothrix sp. UHCC 0171]MEA5569453.1 nuclear transport factor 2 family protein [Calothrix sp. UHCC 0171]
MEKRKNQRLAISSFTPRFKGMTALIAAIVTLIVLLGGTFESALASQPNAESEIEQLTVCYALGTDAIGKGDIQAGKNIYRDCFTEDATITAIFPDGVTTETRVGTSAWGDFVASVFRANGYVATQHLIGTVNIAVQGNTAKMTSYLHATHKRSETSIDVANGTYEDEVIKQNGRWKIRRRTLKLITFLNLSSPPSTVRLSIPSR